VSKQQIPRAHGKTDVRYWREAVFQPSYTRNGARCKIDQYAVKLQFAGRRETIPLGTANRENAAHNETLSVVAVCVNNADRSPARINR